MPHTVAGTDAEMEAETELQLTERALQRNPKSYMAWHHRQWVLRLARTFVPLERELRLLDRLLGVDERNFHAWVSDVRASSLSVAIGTPQRRAALVHRILGALPWRGADCYGDHLGIKSDSYEDVDYLGMPNDACQSVDSMQV